MIVKSFHYTDEELQALKKKDKVLATEIERIGPVEREVIPNIFQALINAIIGQVISTKVAKALWEKMEASLGEISPEVFKNLSIEDIKAYGLTQKKAETIKLISHMVLNKELLLDTFHNLNDDAELKDSIYRYSYLAKDKTKENIDSNRLTQSKFPSSNKTKQEQNTRSNRNEK
jgi:DNA-3-methyladenine glycosylase II